MLNFNLNCATHRKIILLAIAVSFILVDISYAGASSQDSLRVPMGKERTYERLKEAKKAHLSATGTKVIKAKDYYRDIAAAKKEGLISGNVVREDLYSHLKDLRYANTRPLSLTGERLLIEIIMPSMARARIIELGPGAGLACARMSKIAEELQKEIVIDTIGLTPVAPRFRLLLNSMELDRLADIYVMNGGKEIKLLHDQGIERHGISLELAFALHNRSGKVFDVLQKPFIRHQYIGDFREVVIQDKYDFIYEERGALWHVLNIKNNSRQAFDKAMALLDKNGIFYFNGLRLRDWGKFKNLPEDLIFVIWPDDVLVVHKDGIYGRRLAANQAGVRKVAGRAYRFKSFEEVLHMLKGAAAQPAAGAIKDTTTMPRLLGPHDMSGVRYNTDWLDVSEVGSFLPSAALAPEIAVPSVTRNSI